MAETVTLKKCKTVDCACLILFLKRDRSRFLVQTKKKALKTSNRVQKLVLFEKFMVFHCVRFEKKMLMNIK